MFALPKQVEEAADLAEKFMGSFNADPNAVQEDETTEKAETEEESLDTKNEEEEQEEEDSDVQRLMAELKKKDQAFKTLQGKYNAEVPRLQTELNTMKDEIFSRIGDITASKSTQAQKVEATNELIDKLKEEYGDEYYTMLKEVIRQEVSPLLQTSIKPVVEKVDKVSETQAESAKNDFAKSLDEVVTGDWRNAIQGNDEGFLEFLQKPDPSGLYTNAELFDLYNEKWQPEKMAKLMNMYFGEAPVEKQTGVVKKPSPDEEALVAPSRKTKHKTPASNEQRIWTAKSIDDFKLADRQGKYPPEQSTEMWNDLLLALSQNRIQ